MKVIIYNAQRTLPLSKKAVARWVAALLQHFVKQPFQEVVIHLVNKKKISALHHTFFNDPTPTDCISFPLDPDTILGEVFVCPEVAIEYAAKHNKDPYQETALYIIHGLLHLLGFEDENPKERRRMRRAEKRWMKHYEPFLS